MDDVIGKGMFADGPMINLRGGIPGQSRLLKCPELLLEATQALLQKDCDVLDTFSYGYEGGDDAFRHHLSVFLSEEYGDTVDKNCLMMTAGATHGLHVALTLLVHATRPVYVVDPSYFLGHCLIRDDLSHTFVPVPSDSEGPLFENFEHLIKSHQSNNDGDHSLTTDHPYQGAVYLIPTFNNPRGTSYSPETCKRLISLARKYNLILICEDIYNLIYFTDLKDVPKRLLSYDLPSDPDYGKGHVVSNCTFSKILAPAVRLGWIEGPKQIIHLMSKSFVAYSGGAFNHYTGKVVTEMLRSGKEKEFLKWLRDDYKKGMTIFCNILDQDLPGDCSYNRPKGGFFIWLCFKSEMDTNELLEYCENNYRITFLPGAKTSPTDSYANCIRISIAFADHADLAKAGKMFCKACKEFISMKGIK